MANTNWYHNYINLTLRILALGISDHALLYLENQDNQCRKTYQFKFLNNVVNMDGFQEEISNNWHAPIRGNPVYVMWRKLIRVQSVVNKLSKPLMDVSHYLKQARMNLLEVQNKLKDDLDNTELIKLVKERTEKVFKWSEIEEQVIRQRSKINWLKLGDGNNRYFHAQLKVRQNQSGMFSIYQDDGTILDRPEDIENEVLRFYGNLIGSVNSKLEGIDLVAMRDGP
ncbi:unnamed protein product [Lathyrus sativus]|nr:unnamed protein product [Lathyrus sativus]